MDHLTAKKLDFCYNHIFLVQNVEHTKALVVDCVPAADQVLQFFVDVKFFVFRSSGVLNFFIASICVVLYLP